MKCTYNTSFIQIPLLKIIFQCWLYIWEYIWGKQDHYCVKNKLTTFICHNIFHGHAECIYISLLRQTEIGFLYLSCLAPVGIANKNVGTTVSPFGVAAASAAKYFCFHLTVLLMISTATWSHFCRIQSLHRNFLTNLMLPLPFADGTAVLLSLLTYASRSSVTLEVLYSFTNKKS